MSDPRTIRIMEILGGFKTTPEALFVGGCVRNTLMEKPVTDIDIATIHHPLQVIEKLKEAGVRYIPTGLEHGTLTAIHEDASFEITTLRKDIETDGRYAVIAFTTDWAEDAQRRDFTLNTLLASPEGAIFDPTGQGLADLEARRVVFVGDPVLRITEDYLRILRFFRFYAQYGEGSADAAALSASKSLSDKLSVLSKERITQEFLKILSVSKADKILQLMFSNHVLKDMAGAFKPAVMEKLCDMQIRFDAVHLMARVSALSGCQDHCFEDRLVLSNAQKKQIEELAKAVEKLKPLDKRKMREVVYRYGNEIALQGYFLKVAQKGTHIDLEILDIARYWHAPEFPVKAEALIASGIPRGPTLGQKLKELEEKWVSKDFPAEFKF